MGKTVRRFYPPTLAVSQYEYVLQFSGSTVGSEAHMGREHPLPEADINAYVLTAWSGVLKMFTTSAKNSGLGVNFRTTYKISGISAQCPGLQLATTSPFTRWRLA